MSPRVALFCLAVVPVMLGAQSQYHIAQTYPLGGDGSWDYVVPDSGSHRVYIGRETRVMVVDEISGKLLGEVMGIHGAHGTAIAPKSGHGFATSGQDSSILMFDLKTFAVIGRVHAAEDADAILYDPPSGRVFSLNGDAHSSTVVDAATGKLLGNVDLGGKPEYGVSAGDGKVYANLTDVSEVVEIDAKSMTVTRRWSTAPCKQPVSMAIDKVHGRLFSGCRSGVGAVSDIKAGKVVGTVPIGPGNDGAGYDPFLGDAFFSNVDGTLTVVHQDDADHYHVAQTLTTSPNSRNMGVDLANHRIYIVAAKFAPRTDSSAAAARRRPPMIPGSFSLLVIQR